MINIFHFIMSHLDVIFPVVAMAIWGGMQVRKASLAAVWTNSSSHVARSASRKNDDPDFNVNGTPMCGLVDMDGKMFGEP